MRGLRASQESDRARANGEVERRLAQRPPHGPARRGRVHLGGGHQLRPALRAAPGARATTSRSARSSTPSRRRRRPASASATSSPPGWSSPTRTASRWPPCGSGSSSSSPGPKAGRRARAATEADAARPKRPRPALTQDNRFFFEGAKEHKLLIQRCTNCGVLRHPPRPSCANCRSFEWDTVTASGRGTIYSFVVNHYPQVPAFDYPLVVALVELEEGTRLVANVSRHHPRGRGHRHAGGRRLRGLRRRPDPAGVPSGTGPTRRPPTDRDEEDADGLHLRRGAAGRPGGRRRHLRRAGHPGPGPGGGGRRGPRSTASCGPSWPRPTSSA